MSQRRIVQNRIFVTLACAALVLAALLPAGMAPKIAGPCGQALCECETARAALPACCLTREPISSRITLAHGGSQIEHATNTVAFQLVLGAADAVSLAVPSLASAVECIPSACAFAPPRSVSLDVLTPPPRN